MTDQQYLNVKQIVEDGQYPFTRGQVRQMLLLRHRNGLDSAVRKIGRRIYVNKEQFDQWIESHVKGRQL